MRSNSVPMKWRSTHYHTVPFGELAMLHLRMFSLRLYSDKDMSSCSIASIDIYFGFRIVLQTKLLSKYRLSSQPPSPFEDLFPPSKPCTCTIAPLRKVLRTCAQGGWETKAIVGYGVGETQPFQRCINGCHRLSCARCG